MNEARVTSVRSYSTSDGGIEVEVTITRELLRHLVPRVTPDPDDVPGDIRAALRAWLDSARPEWYVAQEGGTA